MRPAEIHEAVEHRLEKRSPTTLCRASSRSPHVTLVGCYKAATWPLSRLNARGFCPRPIRTCVRVGLLVRSLRHPFGDAAHFIASLRARIGAMSRRDWLLILCAYQGAPRGLDPVRLQKGMFIFARSGARPAREQYDFRAYDYGPMSPQIYQDLDWLVAEGIARGARRARKPLVAIRGHRSRASRGSRETEDPVQGS